MSLRAETVSAARAEPEDAAVCPGLWTSGRAATRPIPAAKVAVFARWLTPLAEEIMRSVPGRPITVSVRDVRYVESDFQEEGLAAAIFSWALAEFRLPPREIEARFGRQVNRCILAWPDRGAE
ncbi:hypothetical protein [Actinoplanes sp. NPDC051851]|uniref:hypothetical protein n=1 Tax=Actinoplanes sp. NPDC051851 TaxID=3154753 RepID=UPI0034346FCB